MNVILCFRSISGRRAHVTKNISITHIARLPLRAGIANARLFSLRTERRLTASGILHESDRRAELVSHTVFQKDRKSVV